MRIKNAEDTLQFSIIGSWNKYREALEKRNILDKKQLSVNELKEKFPHVLDNIKKRRWELFIETQREYNETLVREFYVAYATSMTKNQVRRRAYLNSITVREVVVSCGPKSINEIYFENWEGGPKAYDT